MEVNWQEVRYKLNSRFYGYLLRYLSITIKMFNRSLEGSQSPVRPERS